MTNEQLIFVKSLLAQTNSDVASLDHKLIFTYASSHNILPLCYENLARSTGFDTTKYPKLRQKVFSIVFSQTKRTANFKKIYKTILENDIKPLVLKGIVCRNLYGDLCDHRPSGDEDILIKKEDYFQLAEILEENGYIPEEKVTSKTLNGIQEITFKNPNGLNIEVHLNIIGTENKLRRKMNKYFENVFDNAISINIDGQDFYTLGFTEHYIYLFFHMFKHFAMTGVGVRQMLDLFRFGEAYHEKIEWNRVNNAIGELGAGKLYGDILQIGKTYWGFDFENVFGVSFPEKLLEDMFNSGAYGNETNEQIGSKVKVMAALDSGGKTNRLKMLFPSLHSMREFYTVLYDHPYLLPIMWVVRFVRYFVRSKNGETYNVLKSEKIADKKIQLLRDYKII